jgi:hypothetical protein
VGQVEQVGDEHDADPRLDQGPHDLAAYLRAFLLVGGRERLVGQQQAARPELAGDVAHPAQFLVQLAVLHGRVLFPLEVGEDALADAGRVRLGRHEQAALHHQLGQAQAAQKGGLAALVGPGDHDEPLAIGVDVVADGPAREPQAQDRIVEAARGQGQLLLRAGVGDRAGGRFGGRFGGRAGGRFGGGAGGRKGHRNRDAHRRPGRGQGLAQVQAADVEGQLGPEHGEEGQQVVAGLGQRAGYAVQAARPQVRQGLLPGLILVRDGEPEAGLAAAGQPVPPALVVRLAQPVAGALVTRTQAGADQGAPAEGQLLQVVVHAAQVGVVQFGGDHAEEPAEAVRPEPAAVLVGHRPQRPELAGEHLQRLRRPVHQAVRGRAGQPEQAPLVAGHGRDRDVVQPPDHGGPGHRVGQDLLTVGDGVRAGQNGQRDQPGLAGQVVVPGRHRRPERTQLQVLGEGLLGGGRFAGRGEIAVGVHQPGLHRAIRSLRRS